MAGYAPLTRPTKTKTPVGRVKTRHSLKAITSAAVWPP